MGPGIPDLQAPVVDAGVKVFPIVRLAYGVYLARPLELLVVDCDVFHPGDFFAGGANVNVCRPVIVTGDDVLVVL